MWCLWLDSADTPEMPTIGLKKNVREALLIKAIARSGLLTEFQFQCETIGRKFNRGFCFCVCFHWRRHLVKSIAVVLDYNARCSIDMYR
jgi:hypothetical protein